MSSKMSNPPDRSGDGLNFTSIMNRNEEEHKNIIKGDFIDLRFKHQIPDIILLTIYFLYGNEVLNYYLTNCLQISRKVKISYQRYYGLQVISLDEKEGNL